jgi:hypothetical protein
MAHSRYGGRVFVARRPGMRDRLAARVHARQLDHDLAAGADPETTPALALRARRLTAPPRRRQMADGYRRLPRKARGRLDCVGAELAQLADTLEAPGPVTATGAAQAWLLLTDGTGPLYNSRAPAGVRAAAERTLDTLSLDAANDDRA